MLNIAKDVLDYATLKGLAAISTGGGFDYVCKYFSENIIAVISRTDDAGSPDSLYYPAEICFWFNENWTLGMSVQFKTMKKAIDWLVRRDIMVFGGEE